ncbi:hypothetical protein AALP_AA8G304400 [Arabis alpina]|uniref:Uncharacterized protein n=1 Tax=Arabis alpina TaxID=50452 RepID=A0A087GAG9_ARAAL|nr:hypothetical protein AALP_AA8G304400 [Arabis alpina]
MARGTRGCRRGGRGGRGRGRGPVDKPVMSEAQSFTHGPATVQQTSHDGQTASVTASVRAGLGPVGAGVGPVEAGGVGAAGGAVAAAGVAHAGNDRLVEAIVGGVTGCGAIAGSSVATCGRGSAEGCDC